MFANCIALAIWSSEGGSVQQGGYPHIDNLITTINWFTSLDTYRHQQRDLLIKLAKRLKEKGFEDENITMKSYYQESVIY